MKKPPRRQADAQQPRFYASHRVRVLGPGRDDIWQRYNPATEEWEPVDYDHVPDEIWKTGFRRDRWTFYTDRTQPIERAR